MGEFKYVKPVKVSLRDHPDLDEKWLEDRIAADPAILGLGDLELRDRQKAQPRAGRLDLLLQDPDTYRRYEVEIQLGKSDESHIIRTIEYWDIERKRYPQYDHCAVIVAEDITSRFLNVIGLFNGQIPIIAVQMNALKVGDNLTLAFTTVLDELTLAYEKEEDGDEVTDRRYWESKASKDTVTIADDLLELIHGFAPMFELNYKKHYIGLAENGRANNFAAMRPKKKNNLNLEIKLKRSDEIDTKLEEADLDLLTYKLRWSVYHIRLRKNDIEKHSDVLTWLLQSAYDEKLS